MIYNLYKEKGETPLERIRRFQGKNPELSACSITYAGRLDPMAEGVLIVLTHDDVHKKEEINAWNKEYAYDAVLGVETDTYDCLGKVVSVSSIRDTYIEEKIKNFLASYKGHIVQEYPPYSSKTVQGRPLWQWARENKLHEIIIPTIEIDIYEHTLLNYSNLDTLTLKDMIISDIQKIKGDFRQVEIITQWNTVLNNSEQFFPVARIMSNVSSGTYIRGIIYELGKKLGIGAAALNILRTKVGNYSIKDSLR